MNCRDSIDYGCGSKKVNARCVDYEGKHSKCSEVGDCESVSVHKTLESITKQLDEICNNFDFSDVSTSCIGVEPSDKNLPKILSEIVKQLCEVKEKIPNEDCPSVFTQDISCLDIDSGCLADDCNNPPSNMVELLQLLINKACE